MTFNAFMVIMCLFGLFLLAIILIELFGDIRKPSHDTTVDDSTDIT